MSTRPTAVDLFAGAGGMSLGFEQAGFDVVAAVEIDPVHAAIHKFNFPKCAVLPRSIVGLSGHRIRRAAELDGRSVDVVFGGPPCQGFSLIGQRALNDPRNALVREFVRIVVELNASYFVFENVKGLTLGAQKAFLNEIIAAFEAAKYHVQSPWRVINAAHFGVPQDRERLFLMGAKRGLPLPMYPEAIFRPAGSSAKGAVRHLPCGPSCRDALQDLPEADDYSELVDSDSVQTKRWGKSSPYARLLRCDDEEGWFFGPRRKWDPRILTSSMRTGHTVISKRRFAETAPGSVEPISRFFRLSPDGVSNTLRAGTDSARGAFTSPRPIHYEQPRCVTVREMARLHGFPDWFRFHETKWHGARQIGNAVAPPVAREIATQVALALDYRPKKSRQVIKMDEHQLLRLGMSEAAEYWNVDVPIGRRDRKSGTRKRSQEEIEKARLGAVQLSTHA